MYYIYYITFMLIVQYAPEATQHKERQITCGQSLCAESKENVKFVEKKT